MDIIPVIAAIKEKAKLKEYLSTMDLSEMTGQNFMYIEEAVKQLVDSGELAEVGKTYSDKYNKLFLLYTCRVSIAKEMANTIESKQYNTQLTTLKNRLYKMFKQSSSTVTIKYQLQLIKNGDGKISKEFFQLELPQIIALHELIIKDAHSFYANELDHKAKNKRQRFKV